MVEFEFDITPLFPQPIIIFASNLMPPNFNKCNADGNEIRMMLSEIIDRLGKLSAIAQDLMLPITTAEKLRLSNNHQKLYLLADISKNQVIGLLKVGTKTLYLFDDKHNTQKLDNVPCILDFYVHETKQRAGYGKQLFDAMLNKEQWTPVKCCIDRPSDKLMGFIKKHYGLTRIIPQSNNFVLFEGFFDDQTGNHDNHINAIATTSNWQKQQQQQEQQEQLQHQQQQGCQQIVNQVNTMNEKDHKRRRTSSQPMSLPFFDNDQLQSPVGRYAARRPICSMAELLKDKEIPFKGGAAGTKSTRPF